MKDHNYIQLSFDIEDWFQVPFASKQVKRSEWNNHFSIVLKGTNKILKLLKKYNIQATFFIVGWIAKKYPNIVKIINDEGHEVASHGYSHITLDNLNHKEISDDLDKSIEIIYKILGHAPLGYRAPMGSIGTNNLWVLEVLKKKGFLYDSSIYPTNYFVHSGVKGVRSETHEIINGLWEVPLSVQSFLKIPIPLSGGFYLRLIPLFFYSRLVEKHINTNKNTILYFHPWEFETKYPKLIKNPLKFFIQYYNLNSVESKLEKLLDKYSFISIKDELIKNKIIEK